MICIECGYQIDSLYTYYSDNTILATTCPRCGHFADKYIEAELVVVVLDIVLLRPAAMRHVVFNSNNSDTYRIICLVTLFDVYSQWAQSEKSQEPIAEAFLSNSSVLQQYGAFLAMCALDTIVVHGVINYLAKALLDWRQPRIVSTALLLGSSSKLLPILTLIWTYDMPMVATMVRYVVGFCMIEVLRVVLDCGYLYSILLAATAMLARVVVHSVVWNLVVRSTLST